MTQVLALASSFIFVMKRYSIRRIVAEDVSDKRHLESVVKSAVLQQIYYVLH
jgi:hypothetical protein